MLYIRAISNNGVTIGVALEKNAKFSFTIGEIFSQFWIELSIVWGTDLNEFSVFSAIIVVICTGFVL